MRAFNASQVPLLKEIPQGISTVLRSNPLDLEIGAGQGLHAIRYCQTHPDRNLLAVERTTNKFHQLRRRAGSHPQLIGLTVLHADAISLVTHLVAPVSLDRVFLLYPNPYPKSKQSNLRWHNSPFMHELKRKMKPGATLHLATNLKWYADEAQKNLTELWDLSLTKLQEFGHPDHSRTHFERKYLERGEICYDMIFQKK